MINIFRQALHNIPGGRVLDVTNAQGGFIGILKESLKNYAKIIGVDVDKHAIASAWSPFDEEDFCFVQMARERWGFEDQSFDTVSVAASLHHLANPSQALAEMRRSPTMVATRPVSVTTPKKLIISFITNEIFITFSLKIPISISLKETLSQPRQSLVSLYQKAVINPCKNFRSVPIITVSPHRFS